MNLKHYQVLVVFAALTGTGAAQTAINLRTQARDVDFSAAQSTKPFKAGTTLSAVCSIGEFFYKVDGAPGRNLYACIAPSVWAIHGDIAELLELDTTWKAKQIFEPSAMQILSNSTAIAASRAVVQVSATADRTINAVPTIANGDNGQWLTIVNTSPQFSLTLQPEELLPGSNIRTTGGKPLSLGPRESAAFFFNAEVGDWVQSGGGVGGASLFSGLSDVEVTSPSAGHVPFYDAVAGRWKNKGIVGGASGAIAVDASLSPVEVELNATVAKQYLSTLTPGADAIPRADAMGKIASGWLPATAPAAHAASHQHLGADEIGTATPAANAIPKADETGKIASGWLPETAPATHATSHQHLGADEIATATPAANAIPKADETGKIASGWLPAMALAAHAASHRHLGADEIATATPAANAIPKADGTGKIASGWVPAMAPAAHAASHRHLGADEIATATPAANAIPKADETGKIASGWLPAVAPGSHATSHQHLGADEIGTATPAANAIPKADETGKIASGWLPTAKVPITIQMPPVAIDANTARITGHWSTPATNSAVAGIQAVGSGGDQMRVGVLQFGVSGNTNVLFRVSIPNNWDGSAITAKITTMINGGASGNTIKAAIDSFCSSGVNYSTGTALVSTSYNSGTVGTITLDAAPGGIMREIQLPLTVPVTGCSAGSTLWGRLYRDDVNDSAFTTLYVTNVSLNTLGTLQ